MQVGEAETALREALATLEALRPSYNMTAGFVNAGAEDAPIRAAWDAARRRVHEACAAYLKEVGG